MTNDKRYIIFLVLSFAWLMALPSVMKLAGIDVAGKRRPVVPPAQVAADKDKAAEPELAKAPEPGTKEPTAKPGAGQPTDVAKNGAETAITKAVKEPQVAVEQEAALVLGSLIDQSPSGYRLEVQLTQKGAGIESVASSQYKAEFKIGQPVRQPLTLMSNDRPFGPGEHARPPSLAVTFSQGDAAVQPAGADEPKEEDVALRTAAADAEDLLASIHWEVVRDENHKIVRSVSGTDPITNAEIMGQAIVFRTKAANGVVVTKTFRLFPEHGRARSHAPVREPE